jgi:single-strand DNA-binding protein
MPDNSVTLVGNVTREPELRYTAAGQAMAKFGLAVNRRWQNRQTNAWEESTSFFDVVAWREMAENVGESIAKGTRVVVTGRMEQRSYENQAGEKRSATAKVVKNERRGDGDGLSGGGGGSPERAPAAAAPRYEDEEPF